MSVELQFFIRAVCVTVMKLQPDDNKLVTIHDNLHLFTHFIIAK